MPFAQVRDLRMYYETAGDPASGRRLLLLNGSGQDLSQPPSLLDSPLAADFELLAFDQRGLGRTDKPECAYSMADYAADALGLLDHVGWDRCRVHGISFGGMVAQELAVTAPDRVERLALSCTSPGGAGGASYPLHELHERPPEELAELYPRLLDTRGPDAGPLMTQIAKALTGKRGAGGGAPTTDAGFRRQLEARSHHDTFDRLGRLDMPVLIAAGRYDGIAPPENQQAMHANIPGSRLEWFDGGHVFMLQDPRAMPAIREFLL